MDSQSFCARADNDRTKSLTRRFCLRLLSALIHFSLLAGSVSQLAPVDTAMAARKEVARKEAGQKKSAQAKGEKKTGARYACPMNCVTSAKPGKCPKCGMAMREVEDESHPAAPAGEEKIKPGEATASLNIPDTAVVDQDGNKLRFYSDLVKGKTVAINFVFTTCTTICPPLTATFRRVQQELGERVGRDVHLISVSVDPTTDVPARLKGFMAKFNAQPGWTFVTGSKPEVDRLLRALGASVADKNDHTPMILIGNDEAGYWTRTYGLASPSTLVKVITQAAEKKAGDKKTAPAPDDRKMQSANAAVDTAQALRKCADTPRTPIGPPRSCQSSGTTAKF